MLGVKLNKFILVIIFASILFSCFVDSKELNNSITSKKSNRLINQQSPYLLQHAYNPVDWYPWGEEAFLKAKKENKPILLSIGYSTCHWCHVMEEESFSNNEIAAYMNDNFVCIKVDREERPDVDKIYMNFVQRLSGSGGWPLNVWLTSELKPFFGGTYFPPEDKQGRTGFKSILKFISEKWKTENDKIVQSSNEILKIMKSQLMEANAQSNSFNLEIADKAFEKFVQIYDEKNGGFGNAPKFPRPVVLEFLLRYAERENLDVEKKVKAREMVFHTLKSMAEEGIHDKIGGGFHRYATDAQWRLPHFEKMLYNQAQLASIYLRAYQISQETIYKTVAENIFKYVIRDMTNATGGFYSAEDAVSYSSKDSKKKEEGAFYIWSFDEIKEILTDKEFEIANKYYGISEKGNISPQLDHFKVFTQKNILLMNNSENFIDDDIIKTIQKKLFDYRNNRPRPHLDDKIIAAWNGLMISALARSAHAFQKPEYLEHATQAAEYIWKNLYDENQKILKRNYRITVSDTEGALSDYAFYIQSLLDLYESSGELKWLIRAIELQKLQDNKFLDTENGSYFSSLDKEDLIIRMKEEYDGAEPAGVSVTLFNLIRLGQITQNKNLDQNAEKILSHNYRYLKNNPTAMPHLLSAFEFSKSSIKQIILAGDIDTTEMTSILNLINQKFLPNRIILYADGALGQEFLSKHNPEIKRMNPIKNITTVYLCHDFVCQLPTSDLKVISQLLEK